MFEAKSSRHLLYFTAAAGTLFSSYQDFQLKSYWLNNLNQEAQDNCLAAKDRNLLSALQDFERTTPNFQTRAGMSMQDICWNYYANLKQRREFDLNVDYSLMGLSAGILGLLIARCMVKKVREGLSSLTRKSG